LIAQAETIRGWPPGDERHELAENHVRLAIWERGLGRITDDAQHRIYSLLSFVMPDDDAFNGESVPLAELEQETTWVAAYHEQLEQRTCPECGDGKCQVEDR
jgi:hypothetical protein